MAMQRMHNDHAGRIEALSRLKSRKGLDGRNFRDHFVTMSISRFGVSCGDMRRFVRWGGDHKIFFQNLPDLAPAELVEAPIVDSKVVGDFVDDGYPHLLNDLLFG